MSLTWCTKTSTGGSSATPARAVIDRKPNPMRTLNHLQMPAPCSSCGSSAARAASAGASSGAFSAALAQPPGDREGQVISWGPRDRRPSQGPVWEISAVSPRIDTQEEAATKQLVRRNLSWLPPQAYTEDANAPKVFACLPTTSCPCTRGGTGPSSSLPPPPRARRTSHWNTRVP